MFSVQAVIGCACNLVCCLFSMFGSLENDDCNESLKKNHCLDVREQLSGSI